VKNGETMNEQPIKRKRNTILNFTLLGVGFGFLFPILATVIRLLSNRIPITASSIGHLHSTDPLLWIIDTAPFFLGLFAYFVGVRQDNLQKTNEELQQREVELRSIQSSIEQRIQEQTQEISANAKKLELRSRRMEAISKVARTITQMQDLEILLPAIARSISENLGFYHTGIFLVDSNREYATLQSASSEGGQQMLRRGHRLKVGQVGIVGSVAGSGKPRIALDVGTDTVFYNNPDLPQTRSEVALPLKVRESVIGVLDIQSTETAAFQEEDIGTMQTLADQVAVAIENARLFSATQQALSESRAAFGERIHQSWSGLVSEADVTGYRYYRGKTSELQNQPDPTKIRSKKKDEESTLLLPLRLRDKAIGTLEIRTEDNDRIWTEKERQIIEAVADRVALALENASLFSESNRRAEYESLVGQISAKIGASIRMENILQTAADSLGKVIEDANILIQLNPDRKSELSE
jgi:GAF domain-containing protein